MIELKDVSKSYGPRRFSKQVVKACSFVIERNKFTVMIGPSGVGKSTLIRLIAGFEKPDSGQVFLDGAPITGPGRDRLVMFQESALFPWMTTSENVMYGPRARGEDPKEVQSRSAALLARFGLRAFHEKYPSQLSGGMQRRAELARAMINEPALMILDEPFRGLDAMTKKLMLEDYSKRYEAAPRTNFFVTTDVDEAIFLADRLLVMSHLPTRVEQVIEIDLPRPRALGTVVSDDYANRIKSRVLSLLREAAMRSFAPRASALHTSADDENASR